MTQRLVLSGKFEKPNAYQLKAGAAAGSANLADYEPILDPTESWLGQSREEVVTFPPIAASTRPNSNTIRFQGSDNDGVMFVFLVRYKSDDQGWLSAPLRVFPHTGLTPNDAVKLPPGTVAVSMVRADRGGGAVGYVLDLEI